MKKLDLTGQRFGRLVVIEEAGHSSDGRVQWFCKCDCGKTTVSTTTNLKRNHTRSCGCLNEENHFKHGKRTRTNSHSLYGIWDNMKQRCGNSNATLYHRYGGRGITVCQEWREDFQAFYNWAMANGYQDDLTIDRIDNDKGYSPDNCRWITKKANLNNTSQNAFIELNGERHTIAEWSRITGISRKAIDYRIKAGKPPEEILKR